jgi:hypothetical protein
VSPGALFQTSLARSNLRLRCVQATSRRREPRLVHSFPADGPRLRRYSFVCVPCVSDFYVMGAKPGHDEGEVRRLERENENC